MNKKILISFALLVIVIVSNGFTKDKTYTSDIRKQELKTKKEAIEKLAQVKVASLYENITDGVHLNRSVEDTIRLFKETNTGLIFRSFWKWAPIVNSPDEIPVELYEFAREKNISHEQARDGLRKTGHYYEELNRWISDIKEKIPDIIFVGAIPAQILSRIEFNPITGKVYTAEETWAMALDPSKWGIKNQNNLVTKEYFQERFQGIHPYGNNSASNYDRRKALAYFPDITNSNFQELLLSWAKRQIDSGADAIWIDMLYHQAGRLSQITGDVSHLAVKESIDAAEKIIDEIHKYGEYKGKYIYVGSWEGPFVMAKLLEKDFPYNVPSQIDFITVSPTSKEITAKKLNEERWNKEINIIRETYGDIPVFAFIDWSFNESQTVTFSQKMNKDEQAEVLKILDESFGKVGINFIYPLHGGYMGKSAITTKLSFGKYRNYDSLAPEFDTYETIKKLANKKAAKR